jgi:hypothetical protein
MRIINGQPAMSATEMATFEACDATDLARAMAHVPAFAVVSGVPYYSADGIQQIRNLLPGRKGDDLRRAQSLTTLVSSDFAAVTGHASHSPVTLDRAEVAKAIRAGGAEVSDQELAAACNSVASRTGMRPNRGAGGLRPGPGAEQERFNGDQVNLILNELRLKEIGGRLVRRAPDITHATGPYSVGPVGYARSNAVQAELRSVLGDSMPGAMFSAEDAALGEAVLQGLAGCRQPAAGASVFPVQEFDASTANYATNAIWREMQASPPPPRESAATFIESVGCHNNGEDAALREALFAAVRR